MAINTSQLHNQATDALIVALVELYKDSTPDPTAMRGFAEAMAQVAVATAEHIVAHAETELSNERIR